MENTSHEDYGSDFLSFEELHLFEESLNRAVDHNDFLTIFYVRFKNESDEIARFFENTDIKSLKEKLIKTLTLTTIANLEPDRVNQHLKDLGKYHQGLSVPKSLYTQWKDSLIEVARLCDPQYDAKLEKIWQKGINVAIRQLLKGYT